MEQAVVRNQRYTSFPIKFSETPMSYRPVPTLGQHNDYVLGTILGLSKGETNKLEKEKLIGTEPLRADFVL